MKRVLLCAAVAALASSESLPVPAVSQKKEEGRKEEQLATPAPEREALAYAGGTTMNPAKRLAGPIIGAVAGAGVLAGVIAVSAMNQKSTTPAPAVIATNLKGAAAPKVSAKAAGGPPQISAKAAGGPPQISAKAAGGGNGGDWTNWLLIAAGVILVLGLGAFLVKQCRKKKNTKKRGVAPRGPTEREMNLMPEDMQPLNAAPEPASPAGEGLAVFESQYMPSTAGIGSVPTMTNVGGSVFAQGASVYAPQSSVYTTGGAANNFGVSPPNFNGSLFGTSSLLAAAPQTSVYQAAATPTASVYAAAGQSVYQTAGQSVYQQAGQSIYQQAQPGVVLETAQ